jgi:hypothetical protein
MVRLSAVLWILRCVEPARADSLSPQEALKQIGITADQLCGRVPLKHTDNGVELTGTAKAELSGLLKIISSADLSGKGVYTSKTTTGVLDKDLATALENTGNCKLEVLKQLVPRLLPPIPGRPNEDASTAPPTSLSPQPNVPGSFWADNGDIFERIGKIWMERTTNGQCCTYTFQETGRTSTYVELDDSSRSMKLRLPIPSGTSSWRLYNQTSWNPWLNVVYR